MFKHIGTPLWHFPHTPNILQSFWSSFPFVVHSLSIILGILGFKLFIMCGSFQSLVIVSDILSWCVLYGPWQCNIFYILTFSRSDAGNSTCPNKQKVRGKEGASVTLKCIYRLYNVHLRWYRLQPRQAPHFILVKGARSMSTEQNIQNINWTHHTCFDFMFYVWMIHCSSTPMSRASQWNIHQPSH